METCITCGRAYCPMEYEDETLGECEGCWMTCQDDDISDWFPPGSPVCVGCD